MRACLVRGISIGGLIWRFEPCGEAGPCFIGKKLHGGKFVVRLIFAKLGVEESVIEAGASGIGVAGTVVDDIEAGPVAGRETHGAGLATGVEFTALEREGAQGFACGTNGVDLAVGSGVVGGGNGVDAFADDAAVADDDCGEWAARARASVFSSERDSAAEELRIGRGCRGQLAHSLPQGRK